MRIAVAADGFESFVGSQYESDNTHILVGSRSQFLYAFDYAHLKRKGRMTEEQKLERERREAEMVHDRIPIPTSFARLVETMEELLLARVKGATVLYTDEKREYVRETVQFSRSVPNCLERMAVYQMQHNYRKPYRVARKEGRKYLHAEVPGIDRELIEEKLRDIYEQRKFFTHLELTWSQILLWFRMVGNVDRLTGGYMPAYIWM